MFGLWSECSSRCASTGRPVKSRDRLPLSQMPSVVAGLGRLERRSALPLSRLWQSAWSHLVPPPISRQVLHSRKMKTSSVVQVVLSEWRAGSGKKKIDVVVVFEKFKSSKGELGPINWGGAGVWVGRQRLMDGRARRAHAGGWTSGGRLRCKAGWGGEQLRFK